VFPGAARPWARDDGRSAPPGLSSPLPAGPTFGRGPGRPAPATGERGRALPASCTAERCGTRPPLPEGKADRGGRGVVPGGDLVRAHAVAWGSGSQPGCRPAGRAGLPPGTAGIQPPLRPPRQVRRAPAGLDARPRAMGRYGPVPARPGAGVPARVPADGGYRERGTVARTAQVRATVVPAPGRWSGTGTPGGTQRVMLTEGSVIGRSLTTPGFPPTTEIGFSGPFLAPAHQKEPDEAKNTRRGGNLVLHGYIATDRRLGINVRHASAARHPLLF
jgi:hypothetical protein